MNSKRPKLTLMSRITTAWLLYEMATATEASSRALAMVGSLVMLASEK